MNPNSDMMGALTLPTTDHPPSPLTGLTAVEAHNRLLKVGPNHMKAKSPPAWRSLIHQLVHFFKVMFWISSGFVLIAGQPQLTVAIAIVVIVNGVLAFTQEHRAEHTTPRLRELMPRRTTIIRNGTVAEIDATELVPGDLVQIPTGDHISSAPALATAPQVPTIDAMHKRWCHHHQVGKP